MQYIALGEGERSDSEADTVLERLGVRWPNGTIEWFPHWGGLATQFGGFTAEQIIAQGGQKDFQDRYDAFLRKLRLVPGPEHDVQFVARLEKIRFTSTVDIEDLRKLRDEEGDED